MTKTESTIRFLFGASRKDIRPLVHAVDITIKLMFSQGIPMDDIRVTHAVYPQVAKRLKTRSGASPSAKTTARRDTAAGQCVLGRPRGKKSGKGISRYLPPRYSGTQRPPLLLGCLFPLRDSLL